MFKSDTYSIGYLLPVVNNKPIKKTVIFKKYPVYFVSKCQTIDANAVTNAVYALRCNHFESSSIFATLSSTSAWRVPNGGFPLPSCSLHIGSSLAVSRSSINLISVISSCIISRPAGSYYSHQPAFLRRINYILLLPYSSDVIHTFKLVDPPALATVNSQAGANM